LIRIVSSWARSELVGTGTARKSAGITIPFSLKNLYFLGTFVYKGRLFVIGGDNKKGPLSTIEFYDPQFDRWRILPHTLQGIPLHLSVAIKTSE
jgi:hypothetical protein